MLAKLKHFVKHLASHSYGRQTANVLSVIYKDIASWAKQTVLVKNFVMAFFPNMTN